MNAHVAHRPRDPARHTILIDALRRNLILLLVLMGVVAMSYIIGCALVEDDIMALESMHRSAQMHEALLTRSGIVSPSPIRYIPPGFPRHPELLLYSLLMSLFTLLILGVSWQHPVTTDTGHTATLAPDLLMMDPPSSGMDSTQLQSIHRMLVTLSHQLRNPLAAAMGNMELLSLTVGEESRPADKLQRIQRGLDELHAIANFFLDQNATTSQEGAMLDLNLFLDDILREEGLLQDVDFSPHLERAPIYMEQMMMRYAFLHLLQSARRRSRNISLDVEVMAHGYHIEIKARRGPQPRIVGDAPPDEALLSLEREEQLRLTIARKVIEAHGGRVTLNHEASSPLYHLSITLPGPPEHDPIATSPILPTRPSSHSPKDHYHG